MCIYINTTGNITVKGTTETRGGPGGCHSDTSEFRVKCTEYFLQAKLPVPTVVTEDDHVPSFGIVTGFWVANGNQPTN